MVGPAVRPLRLVLDTNVVVAGLLWSGPPRRLLEWSFEGELIELVSSPALLDELAHTLGYAKFAGRIQLYHTSVEQLVARYTALVSLTIPPDVPRVVAADADDDHVLAAAVAASADLLITGDKKHLLPMRQHLGIAITTARLVVERIEASQ